MSRKKRGNRCANCGGLLMQKEVRFDQHWGERIVVFENVPARVCMECGESWFDAKTLKKMDVILAKNPKPLKRLSVPVWSFA